MDNDPINEGHVLVIPKAHFFDLDECPKDLLFEAIELSQKIVRALKQIYNPDGYSVMQNGGIFNDIGHYHLHIFPRYKNDGFKWTFSENKFDSTKQISDRIRDLL